MAFSGLDLRDIVESDDKGEGEEDGKDGAGEGAEEHVKVGVGQADAATAPEVVVGEEALVEEVIAKAMVRTEVMVVGAAEGQGLVWTDTHE